MKVKIPYWIWTGLIIICISQWTVGLWIESVTNSAKIAFIVIVSISFVLYPIYCFIVLSYIHRKKFFNTQNRIILYVFLVIGFVTNPAVLQFFKQIF